jgi:hypothetical protein
MLPTQPGGGAPGSAAGPQGARLHNPTEAEPHLHPSRVQIGKPATADQRHRVSWYASKGLLPQGVTPCSIAAAHTRATGQQPARDPERRQYRAYSPLELLAALAELSRERQQKAIAAAKRLAATAPPLPPPPPPPPAPPPETVWLLALGWLASKGAPVFRFSPGRLLGVIPQGKPGEVLAVVELPDPNITADQRSWLGHALAQATRQPTHLRVLPRWNS